MSLPSNAYRSHGNKNTHIAIDLTHLIPGGENGGVKLLAMELARRFGELAAGHSFTLITNANNNDELEILESTNVRRVCLGGEHVAAGSRTGIIRRAVKHLPFNAALKRIYRSLVQNPRRQKWLETSRVDLVFCPFTRPFVARCRIPQVSLICDLQFLFFPRFFSHSERSAREKVFREAARWADRVICISDYVRETVLQKANVPRERVLAIPISMAHRFSPPSIDTWENLSNRLSLQKDQFLLYPANFWPHKNHDALLAAFSIFRKRNPASPLKLVCTGHGVQSLEKVVSKATELGLEDRVRFPGYVATEELSALLRSSKALIYPSLYEGFGMPLLEAMSFGKPVLCSQTTSLPEVAGDAAFYFDPRSPEEIARAIEMLEGDDDQCRAKVAKGLERARLFGDPQQMAMQYLDVFDELLGCRPATDRSAITTTLGTAALI